MDRLEHLSDLLMLSGEEKATMLNLAGEKRDSVAPGLPEYIRERDYVSAALRVARDLDTGEDERKRFVADLEKRKG